MACRFSGTPKRGLALALAVLVSACNNENNSDSGISLSGSNQEPDPIVQDFPLIFIRRPLILDENNIAATSPNELNIFQPGAELVFKQRATPSAEEIILTAEVDPDNPNALYDIRDIEPDFDGGQIVFSMRGPYIEDADLEDQPSWNIWTYHLESQALTRVITSDTTAEAGQDRDPHFLADGRIVFTSNRQRTARAIQLNEGRPQYSGLDEDGDEEAFVLHVMNDDGTDIEQLSFNQSHDQDPMVRSDGRIVFTRWDNVPGRDVFSLYQMNPDGSALQTLYGYHRSENGRDGSDVYFDNPRELEDGRLLVLGSAQGEGLGSDLLILDTENFIDADQPSFNSTSTEASGQTSPLTEVVSLSEVSRRGRFASVWPLNDGTERLLISWSQCRLEIEDEFVPCTDENTAEPGLVTEAPALYGLWILNPALDEQQPVVTPAEDILISEAIVVAPRANPIFLGGTSPDEFTQDLINENAGVLHIRSVYDMAGEDTATPDLRTLADPSITPSDARPARFLRLVKPVAIPDDEVIRVPGSAFGRSRNEGMREILGYAPIHPDGSVYVKLPANVPFALSILDGLGQRVSERHRNWLQVRPGEVLNCNGCHASDSTLPHGRPDAEADSINNGAPYNGLDATFVVDAGMTMAEGFANLNGAPAPDTDVTFDDLWTDPTRRAKDASFAYRYQDLTTPAPLGPGCSSAWIASCRQTIHYPDHIQPVWLAARTGTDPVTGLDVDRTCTSCHSPTDDMGAARVPAGQLDLSETTSNENTDHLTSYRELLFNDAEQEVVNGALVDRLEPLLDGNGNPVFEVDDEGNLILDAEGNPIPVLTTFNVSPTMRTGGALASSSFLTLFRTGGSHEGDLTDAELKLIVEWLDIGAQYYNDPFRVPQ